MAWTKTNGLAFVFGLGLALRLALIARFPLIFGGDSKSRLLHRDEILLSHQLPLLQLLVYGIGRLTHDYVAFQVATALIGAAAGAAFYLLARDLVEERAALFAGLLLATNPFLVAFSIVPYQESLMLGLVCLAFHFYFQERPVAASVCLGLACLTRYEAWAAGPVLAAAYIGSQRTALRVLKGLVLFGWAPAIWIAAHRGFAPAGSFVLEKTFTPARLVRWVYLGYITAKFTPLIVVALGFGGLWLLWRERQFGSPRLWPLVCFWALFAVALLFSAHGDYPDPDRRIASREAHLWIAAIVMLGAFALERAGRLGWAVTAVGMLLGAWGAYRYVQRETSDPHLWLSYRLAKTLDAALQPNQRVLILSPPWPSHVLTFYPERARAIGGEESYQAALREMAKADLSPPAYQRTLVHSRLDRDRLLWNPGTCTEWVAVWSDYAGPTTDLPPPQTILRDGDFSVRISRQVCQ